MKRQTVSFGYIRRNMRKRIQASYPLVLAICIAFTGVQNIAVAAERPVASPLRAVPLNFPNMNADAALRWSVDAVKAGLSKITNGNTEKPSQFTTQGWENFQSVMAAMPDIKNADGVLLQAAMQSKATLKEKHRWLFSFRIVEAGGKKINDGDGNSREFRLTVSRDNGAEYPEKVAIDSVYTAPAATNNALKAAPALFEYIGTGTYADGEYATRILGYPTKESRPFLSWLGENIFAILSEDAQRVRLASTHFGTKAIKDIQDAASKLGWPRATDVHANDRLRGIIIDEKIVNGKYSWTTQFTLEDDGGKAETSHDGNNALIVEAERSDAKNLAPGIAIISAHIGKPVTAPSSEKVTAVFNFKDLRVQ